MKYVKTYEVYNPDQDHNLLEEFYLNKVVDLSKLPFPIKEQEVGKWLVGDNIAISFDKFPEIDYPISEKIFATKSYLSRTKLNQRLSENNNSPIYIVTHEGKDYLLSGHQRYAAAIKRGDGTIKAKRVAYLG